MSNRNRDVHGHCGRQPGTGIFRSAPPGTSRTASVETWENVTGAEPRPPQEPEPAGKRGPGRPPSLEHPAPIPDSPEDIARVLMSSPPKKNWRHLEGKLNGTGKDE